MAVIVELLGLGGRARRHFRVEGDSATIGRDYSNDVVLSDSHISPRHLRLEADEGGWRLVDLDSLNGVQVMKNPGTRPEVLAPGGELKLGRTRLRIVDEGFSVDETEHLHPLDRNAERLGRAPVWIVLLLAVFSIEAGQAYLAETARWEWKNALGGLVGVPVAAFLAAAFWALAGRIVRNETYYFSQLSLILLFPLLGIASAWVLKVSGYNAGSAIFDEWLIPVSWWLLFSLLLVSNMVLATNLSTRMRWTVATSCTALCAALLLTDKLSGVGEFSSHPNYHGELEPPALLMVAPQPSERFLADLDELFDHADKMLKQ